MSIPDYFVNSKIIESFAKSRKAEGEDKKKYIYLSFQLKSESEINTYAIQFNRIDVKLFKEKLVSSKYGDDLSAEQLSNIEKLSLTDFSPEIIDENKLSLPYDKHNVTRFYRLIIDITGYDGKDGKPDYKDMWNRSPITIVALSDTIESSDNIEIPKLSLELDITDCDIIVTELIGLVDELGSDLPLADIEFIKNIIGSCNCGGDTKDVCEIDDISFDNITLPTLESESILYELTNMDSLICYLKNQLIKYKTEIAITSGSNNNCYKFVPCLVRAYISVNKVYRKAYSAHQTLLVSARYLVSQYNALAADHRRGIESIKGIVNNNVDWIKSNLDSEFDLSKVTCSNRVSARDDSVYTFKERYSSYFNRETKRYSGFDD